MHLTVDIRHSLEPRHGRITLVECSRRPGRRACAGLLSVVKTSDDTTEAHCESCHRDVSAVKNTGARTWSPAHHQSSGSSPSNTPTWISIASNGSARTRSWASARRATR